MKYGTPVVSNCDTLRCLPAGSTGRIIKSKRLPESLPTFRRGQKIEPSSKVLWLVEFDNCPSVGEPWHGTRWWLTRENFTPLLHHIQAQLAA